MRDGGCDKVLAHLVQSRIILDSHGRPFPERREPGPSRGEAWAGQCPGTTDVAESEALGPLLVANRPEDKFREFLSIRGEKLTEPRRVLVRHIFDSHKHFDADELVADL